MWVYRLGAERAKRMLLTGDKVTLKTDKEEVQRMTVTGKPARYNHVTEKGETIEAESDSMVYTASENTLVMKGNATLQQPDHKVTSQLITYDTLKKIVIAGTKGSTGSANTGKTGDNKEGSRVNITLTPKKKVTDDASNKQ
jgi:lipopolysaccharide transport protein LptA